MSPVRAMAAEIGSCRSRPPRAGRAKTGPAFGKGDCQALSERLFPIGEPHQDACEKDDDERLGSKTNRHSCGSLAWVFFYSYLNVVV